MATGPGHWVHDDDGTYDPQAVCPHCETDHGQVLGGSGRTVRCRCTNSTCERTFLHVPWQDRELRGVRHSRRGAALRPDVRVAPPTNSGPRALGPGAGKAEPVRTRPQLELLGAASAPLIVEGTVVPTERELEQLRDASLRRTLDGEDASGLVAVHDLVSGAVPGPESEG